jgi:hypothetical protein
MKDNVKKIIYGYLNGLISHEPHLIDNFIIVYFPDMEDDFEDSIVWLEYDYEDGRLFVDGQWFKEIFSPIFGLSFETGKNIIKDWFEYYFGVKIEFVDAL